MMKELAVFDMDIIVSENNYKRAGREWLNLALWLSMHVEKHTVLFGNAPSPFYLDTAYLTSYTKVHNFHLHCSNEVRTKRLIERGWTTTQIADELYYADYLFAKAASSNPPIPILDTSQLSVMESAAKVSEWINLIISPL